MSPDTANSPPVGIDISDPFDPNARPRSNQQQSQIQGQTEQWTCEICTCINPMQYLACDACGCERPESVGQQQRQRERERAQQQQPPRPPLSAPPAAGRREQSMGWLCTRCGTFMEHVYWTCSSCGKMKESS